MAEKSVKLVFVKHKNIHQFLVTKNTGKHWEMGFKNTGKHWELAKKTLGNTGLDTLSTSGHPEIQSLV